VDRSGAYIARELAVKYLLKNNARMCEVEIGYSIGLSKPLSIKIKYYDTKEKCNKFQKPTEEDYEACKVGNIVKRYNDIIKQNPNWIPEICKYGHFTKRDIV
ncbi:MAG: methionine adenosyltransferase domain-containing protein, partial [Lachnospiraceae bacterium]|nr:methionine adenosyltransferase domain-containing protein [Lachnospiraceae bacterium]